MPDLKQISILKFLFNIIANQLCPTKCAHIVLIGNYSIELGKKTEFIQQNRLRKLA